MQHHLYGILERLPHPARLPEAGIDDHPVHARRVGTLVVLGTLVDRPPRPGPRALGRHLEVVGAMSSPGPLFPLRYGVTVAAEELTPWLAARAGAIRTGLSLVRGRVEMRVSVLALHFGQGDAERLREVADRVTAVARNATCRSRIDGRGGNAAVTLAFLVPRGDETSFLARIAPVAARAGDVAVVPSGPWPAWSFVPPIDLPAAAASGRMAVAAV
jgi:gas vesicle protein GvpL/GvpF